MQDNALTREPGREASQAVLDPMRRLGMAVVKQALIDLAQGEPLERLDAWIFLTGDAPIWCEALGFPSFDADKLALYKARFEKPRRVLHEHFNRTTSKLC